MSYVRHSGTPKSRKEMAGQKAEAKINWKSSLKSLQPSVKFMSTFVASFNVNESISNVLRPLTNKLTNTPISLTKYILLILVWGDDPPMYLILYAIVSF